MFGFLRAEFVLYTLSVLNTLYSTCVFVILLRFAQFSIECFVRLDSLNRLARINLLVRVALFSVESTLFACGSIKDTRESIQPVIIK